MKRLEYLTGVSEKKPEVFDLIDNQIIETQVLVRDMAAETKGQVNICENRIKDMQEKINEFTRKVDH